MAKKQELKGQQCPMCGKKTLTLSEAQMEVPFFGSVFVFGMKCNSCKYFKSDVEAEKVHEPCKCTLEVKGKDDLKARVIRSSEGLIKIPHVGSISPGPDAEGFVSNVEGVIERFKKQVEAIKETTDDDAEKKKAKNMLKKLQKVLFGSEKIKIIIEDKTGNSAIISDKAKREKLKK